MKMTQGNTRAFDPTMNPRPPLLYNFLLNSVIFRHFCPYMTIHSLLNLAAASKFLRSLIFHEPAAFRYLDLSTARGASIDIGSLDRGGTQWRSQRMDESTTEEDFYSGPLRGIFSYLKKKHVLGSVRTLILDGQSAPAEILRDIICDDPFQVQVLSVVGSKNLNQNKFQQVLRYAVRPSRPEGSPKLRAVYFFGMRKDSLAHGSSPEFFSGVLDSPGAQLGVSLNRRSYHALHSSFGADMDAWYSSSGRVIPTHVDLQSWPATLKACQNIIYFDAVLCRGPKHDHSNVFTNPQIASVALKGCEVCRTLPEGPATSSCAPSALLPLLKPVPRHTLSIKQAQIPCSYTAAEQSSQPQLLVRCLSCCQERWCEGCNKFWCEDHYDTTEPLSGSLQSSALYNAGAGRPVLKLKVHLGLCIETCLVNELIQGSDGMWA